MTDSEKLDAVLNHVEELRATVMPIMLRGIRIVGDTANTHTEILERIEAHLLAAAEGDGDTTFRDMIQRLIELLEGQSEQLVGILRAVQALPHGK